MTVATPWLLAVAALAPAVVLALHVHDRRRRAQLYRQLGELAVVGRVVGSASAARRRGKAALIATAAALLGVAAARPQLDGTREVELRGLDLAIAVDVSKSMLVEDVGAVVDAAGRGGPPSRLARARALARAVIDELPGDRIAPIVFAAAAAHFPLTEDHVVAASFLDDLGPADLPQGSDLGEVFRVARCLLRPDLYADLGCAQIGRRGHGGDPLRGERLEPAGAAEPDDAIVQKVERGKAILMFTDGGDPSPAALREVAAARELGIAVVVVGIGSVAGGVVHELDASGRATATVKHLPGGAGGGAEVVSRRDDVGLGALAAAAGDRRRYLIAAERGAPDPTPIVQALRAVHRGLATRRIKDVHEVYPPLVFAALVLLLVEAAIGTRRRLRFPEQAP